MLIAAGSQIKERGKDYNHSSFCDLVISGLLGLQPQVDGSLVIEPLIPEGKWDYFALTASYVPAEMSLSCMTRTDPVMARERASVSLLTGKRLSRPIHIQRRRLCKKHIISNIRQRVGTKARRTAGEAGRKRLRRVSPLR